MSKTVSQNTHLARIKWSCSHSKSWPCPWVSPENVEHSHHVQFVFCHIQWHCRVTDTCPSDVRHQLLRPSCFDKQEPISDTKWKTIAFPQTTCKLNAVKGLSLSSNSSRWYAPFKSKFGNTKYFTGLRTISSIRGSGYTSRTVYKLIVFAKSMHNRPWPVSLLVTTKGWARQAEMLGLITPASCSLFTSVWKNSVSGEIYLLNCTTIRRQSALKVPTLDGHSC